jgi:hypothetical protein
MNKQDRAFTGWLNHLLMPYTPEYLRAASEGDTSAALSDLRLAARVQGAMAACYRYAVGTCMYTCLMCGAGARTGCQQLGAMDVC